VANLTYQGVSVEFAVLVVVHLDARLVVVDAFGNDTEAREALEEFLLVNVLGQRSDVDRCVDALSRLLVLRLLCIFLKIRSAALGSSEQYFDDTGLTFSASTALRFLLGSSAGSSSSTPGILYAARCCSASASSIYITRRAENVRVSPRAGVFAAALFVLEEKDTQAEKARR